MDPQVDLFCARQLVTSLYVTPEQVQEAFEIQRAMRREGGAGESLLDLLLAKGHIDRDQADEVAAAVEAARAEGKFAPLSGDAAEAEQDAAGASAAAGVPAGLQLPGVTLEARVGTGVTGVDFRGMHVKQGVPVLVHVLFPKFARDADARDEFMDEGESAAEVDHPNVLPLLETGESGSKVYAIHLWPAGRSLEEVAADGPLDEERVREIGRQVADALVAAGQADFEHGSLRPDSIFVDTAGGDAVQVRFPVRPQDEAGPLSPADAVYAPPEYQPDAEPDPSADLYALGACCMHALVGRPPLTLHEDDTVDSVLDRAATGLPRLNDLRPDVSPAMATLVDWLTAPSPNARPVDAQQASTAFAMAATGVEPIPDKPVRGEAVTRSPAAAKRPVVPRRETRREKRRAGGTGPRRPSRGASSSRPAPRSRPEPSPRGRAPSGRGAAAAKGGMSPAVLGGAVFGGLLLLIAVIAMVFSGGDPPPKRGKETAKKPRFKPAKKPAKKPATKPAKQPTEKPAKKPDPKQDPPAAPDRTAQKEDEARDYLAKAEKALSDRQFSSAAQMLDYLLRTYADTDFVKLRQSHIQQKLNDAVAAAQSGQAPPPPGPAPGPGQAPPGTEPAPLNTFTLIDCNQGDWQPYLRAGALAQVVGKGRGLGFDGHSACAFTVQQFGDVSLQARVTVTGDAQSGAGLIFRYDPSRQGLYELIVARGEMIFIRIGNGQVHRLAGAQVQLAAGTAYTLLVVARGGDFEGYIDGRLVLRASDATLARGCIGFSKLGVSTVQFDDVQFQDRAVSPPNAGAPPPPAPAPGPAPGPAPAPAPAVDQWKVYDGGEWKWLAPGVAEGKGEGFGSYGHAAWIDRASGPGDGVVECEVKLLPSEDGAFAGLALRSDGSDNALECYLFKTEKGAGWRIARFEKAKWKTVATGGCDVVLREWAKLRVEFGGGSITFTVDGKQVFAGECATPSGSHCGIVKYGKTHAQFRRMKFPKK